MSTDNTAPVHGPPKRNNYAEWKFECRSERPLPDAVETSNDHYQRALLGCHLPPVKSRGDGAVAASLTFREQKPPKPPFRCPDRTESECKPPSAAAESREVKRYSVCEKAALQKSYRTQVESSQPPPQFVEQQRPWTACHERDDKVGVPPYVTPDRQLSGIPVRAATDCVYQYIRSASKDGPRPPPLETTLLQRGDLCGPAEHCHQHETLKAVAERRCAKAGTMPTDDKSRAVTETPVTAAECRPSLPKPLPCGLTGVAEPYVGGPPLVAAEKPVYLPQAPPTPPCPERRHPGVTQVPPFVWPTPRPGTRIRSCTDCLPKRPCPGDPPPAPAERCAHFSPVCELGYFGQLLNEPCVYPCCVDQQQSEQLARQMRWTTMARTQMEELKYPPRAPETKCFENGKFVTRSFTDAVVTLQKVAMPTTTYEKCTDPVKYRVQRYEPAASLCQQVPDVWDRAQTRQMIDYVTGDSDYVPKVNETLPTGEVARNNKMVMKPCQEPSRYCAVSRDILVNTPCKFGETNFTPDVDPTKIVCPSCI